MSIRHTAFVALFATSLLSAQTSFPRTITASCSGGTTRFTQEQLEVSATPFSTPLADFTATGVGNCDDDVMFAHGNYWRLASDPGLSQFYDSSVGGDQGGITQTNSADSWTVVWPDADNRGVLEATWIATATCCGATCGRATHEWTLRNTSSSAITLEFYAYTDLDYAVSPHNDTMNMSTGDRHWVRQNALVAPACEGFAEFRGEGITNWEVNGWPAIEFNMLSSNFTPLSGATLPISNADYEGVMGWTLNLAAGASQTVVYSHGHNCIACTQAPQTSNFGTAHGAMTLSTQDLASPGCPWELDVTGPANISTILLIGLPNNLQLPGCPQSLYVEPSIGSLTGTLDGSGQLTFELPAAVSTVFCGLTLGFQAFGIVAGEPCVPLQHTDGLTMLYGSL